MKTMILTIAMVAAAQASFAGAFQEGTYKGNGLWDSGKTKGGYQSLTEIQGDVVKATYNYDGKSANWNFKMRPTSGNFFDVLELKSGVKVGSGYCLENTVVCHYQLEMSSVKLEETLVQMGEKLYRYGSKDEGQGLVMWQESLVKQ